MLHRCAGVQIANQAWGWEARIGRTAEHSWCLQQLDTRTYIGKREDIRSLACRVHALLVYPPLSKKVWKLPRWRMTVHEEKSSSLCCESCSPVIGCSMPSRLAAKLLQEDMDGALVEQLHQATSQALLRSGTG